MSGFQFVTISGTNLSPFRFSIDGHASKVLQTASLARQLEDVANMESMFGQGEIFLRVKAARTSLRFEYMCTRALLSRQEQRLVGKSHVASTEAILEVVPALFYRQEQCRQEQDVVAKSRVLWTRTLVRAFLWLGRPGGVVWEA